MVEATVQQSLPERVADGNRDENSRRRGVYGEDYSIALGPRVHGDEGSYIILRNATPGTGIPGHAAPTTHDTEKAFLMLRHGGQLLANSKRTYLDYIKLVVTAAGTGGTLNYATHTIDVNRTFTSGGGDLTAVNPNMLAVLQNELKFGAEPQVSGAVLEGVTELERLVVCPPVIFGPGQSYHLVLWRASQTVAASYEVEIGLWQR